MPTLSDSELEQMRATIQDTAMPDLGNILEVSYTPDAQGGVTEYWRVIETDIPYRLDFKQGNMQIIGGGSKPFSFWQLSLPYSTTITTDNRFQDAGGTRYSISSIDKDKSWCLDMKLTVEAV